MNIGGFQKLTLLDFPGEVACIIFTAGCNFRCPFCHNSALLSNTSRIAETEIFDYLKKRAGILDGAVISGGEPLMQPDIVDFIRKIRDLGYLVKLDTNGSYPDKLSRILDEGLIDYAAMDIKHVPKKYPAAVGTQCKTADILRSIRLLKDARIQVEFRTTFVKGIHEKSDAQGIARFLDTSLPYYIQSYVDSGGVLMPRGLSAFSENDLREMSDMAREYCPNTHVRGM